MSDDSHLERHAALLTGNCPNAVYGDPVRSGGSLG